MRSHGQNTPDQHDSEHTILGISQTTRNYEVQRSGSSITRKQVKTDSRINSQQRYSQKTCRRTVNKCVFGHTDQSQTTRLANRAVPQTP